MAVFRGSGAHAQLSMLRSGARKTLMVISTAAGLIQAQPAAARTESLSPCARVGP